MRNTTWFPSHISDDRFISKQVILDTLLKICRGYCCVMIFTWCHCDFKYLHLNDVIMISNTFLNPYTVIKWRQNYVWFQWHYITGTSYKLVVRTSHYWHRFDALFAQRPSRSKTIFGDDICDGCLPSVQLISALIGYEFYCVHSCKVRYVYLMLILILLP